MKTGGWAKNFRAMKSQRRVTDSGRADDGLSGLRSGPCHSDELVRAAHETCEHDTCEAAGNTHTHTHTKGCLVISLCLTRS